MGADETFTVAINAESLRSRIAELGVEVSGDYAGRVPVMIGVLTGALPFLADLVRAIEIELEVDFLSLSRFGEGGRVRFALDTALPLAGRDVLIVEDIVDTGLTLNVLRRTLLMREVASIATIALIDKVSRRVVDVPVEYRGFEVGDEYLVGYGLDWEGFYRNLPDMYAILDMEGFGKSATGHPFGDQ